MKQLLIRYRNLALLWAGHVISHSGDAIYQLALPWLVLELTGSKSTTSLVAVAAYLPAVLFSLVAGVVVDRFDHRRVMMFADLARMGVMLALVGYLLTGGASPIIIGLIAFAVASFATLFYPAREALVPDLVPPAALTSANAFLSTSGQFAHLAGPLLAAALVIWVGLTHLFTIDALSFGASLLFLALIGSRRPMPARPDKPSRSHMADIVEGLRFVRRERALGLLILLTALNNLFIMGPAVIGTPIFVREVLQLDFRAFATVEAFMAAGMLIGSLTLLRFGKAFNPSVVLFAGMVMDGLTYSALYFMDTYTHTKALLLVHGIGIPLITVSRTTIIQTVVPRAFRGRVFSMVTLSVIGLTALSSGLVGPLAEVVPIQTIFLGIGVGAAGCGFIGLSHRGMMQLARNRKGG
ncbi:MAG: MFS transporter [Candidatus Neomarinimicrobiota bacterium]